MSESLWSIIFFVFIAGLISCNTLLRLSNSIKEKDFSKSSAILKQLVLQIFISLVGIITYLILKN